MSAVILTEPLKELEKVPLAGVKIAILPEEDKLVIHAVVPEAAEGKSHRLTLSYRLPSTPQEVLLETLRGVVMLVHEVKALRKENEILAQRLDSVVDSKSG